MRDEPLRECPKDLCRLPKWGHGKVKRLLGTGAGIIFKGSGFYSTDYRSKAYQEAPRKRRLPPAKNLRPAKNLKRPAKNIDLSPHRLNRRRIGSMTTTMTKIVCGECRHENEAERIYCHNCGERLDRSMAAAQKPMVDRQRHIGVCRRCWNRRAGAVTISLL